MLEFPAPGQGLFTFVIRTAQIRARQQPLGLDRIRAPFALEDPCNCGACSEGWAWGNIPHMKHIKEVRVDELQEPISHYTDAVLSGSTLYISGLIATDGDGNVIGKNDVIEQARQIFRNMALVLKAVHAAPSDVVKITVFMRDITQRASINPVRQEFFGTHRPASTLVEISQLVNEDLLLEIEAVAVVETCPTHAG